MLKKIFLIFLLITLTSCAGNNTNKVISCAAPIKSPGTIPTISNSIKPITSQANIDVTEDEPQFPAKIVNKDEILPVGWSMLDILENDFNGDGLLDIVGVVEHPIIKDGLNPRILFVYMNNSNGYTLNMVNQYLIQNRDELGWMDTYQKLTAQGDTFTTHAFGGTGWKWRENYTFNYKDGEWFLLYKENIGGRGNFETFYRYDDYKVGVGKRRYTEDSPGIENPKKLEFTVKLDEQPTLTDFTYYNRIMDQTEVPVIKSHDYNEGIPHFKGDFPTLRTSNVSFNNTDYIVYIIDQSEEVKFLGVYDFAKEHLQIIARYPDNGKTISSDCVQIYKNWLYFQEEITKMVDIREDGEIKKQSGTVGVQLVSMNLDGSDKKVIFKADDSKYKENEIIENNLDYISLGYEITGDEMRRSSPGSAGSSPRWGPP
jgi:hypothetical protein